MNRPDRPRCYSCDKPLTPVAYEDKGHGDIYWRGYGSDADRIPIFCSLGCALGFATQCVRAGSRVRIPPRKSMDGTPIIPTGICTGGDRTSAGLAKPLAAARARRDRLLAKREAEREIIRGREREARDVLGSMGPRAFPPSHRQTAEGGGA